MTHSYDVTKRLLVTLALQSVDIILALDLESAIAVTTRPCMVFPSKEKSHKALEGEAIPQLTF
jgi:hypothetical protein